jgi:hypothetical protein
LTYSKIVKRAIINDPKRKPKNFNILWPPTENSSTITSDAEIYKKVPAEIERKTASKTELIPDRTIPNIIPAGVVSEKRVIKTINTSLSIFDLFRLIP